MVCDHMYSVPQLRPRPTRRCSESWSALKVLFPSCRFSSMRPKVGSGRTLVIGSTLLMYCRANNFTPELPV